MRICLNTARSHHKGGLSIIQSYVYISSLHESSSHLFEKEPCCSIFVLNDEGPLDYFSTFPLVLLYPYSIFFMQRSCLCIMVLYKSAIPIFIRYTLNLVSVRLSSILTFSLWTFIFVKMTE